MKRPKKAKPKRYYSPKRRHAMSLGENIVHVEIFERDGWVCWLCERPIDRRLRQPNWWCATIDHVRPMCAFEDLSKWHTRDNVRAAHAYCNYTKGDSIMDNMSDRLIS